MIVIGVHGLARSGKSTFSDCLRKQGLIEMALADGMKRFLYREFNFPEEALWGSSSEREWVHPELGKSVREVLQTMGTEWGRNMVHSDIWVIKLMQDAKLIATTGMDYVRFVGPSARMLSHSKPQGIVVSDVRFPNEAEALRKRGAHLVKLARPEAGLRGQAAQHASEAGLPNELFDTVLVNDGTLEELHVASERVLKSCAEIDPQTL